MKEISKGKNDDVVADYLATDIVKNIIHKKDGHRLAIIDLTPGLLEKLPNRLEEKIRDVPKSEKDLELSATVVVVGEKNNVCETGTYSIVSPTKLIELRNDETVKILVALIPNSSRSYADDSYAEHNFEFISPRPCLESLKESLVEKISDSGFPDIRIVLENSMSGDVERQIRYLLTVIENGLSWRVIGAFIYILGLIPDFELNNIKTDTKLSGNRDKMSIITDHSISGQKRIDKLNLKDNFIKEELVRLFDVHKPHNVIDWGREIVEKDDARLSYGNWITEHISEKDYDLEILPLSKSNHGMTNIDGEVEIPKNGKIKVDWKYTDRKFDTDHFTIRGYRDEEELFVKPPIHSMKIKKKTIDLDGIDDGYCVLKIEAVRKDGQILDARRSDKFQIGDNENYEEDMSEETDYGDEVFSLAEARVLAAIKNKKKSEPVEIKWVQKSKKSNNGPTDVLKIKFENRFVCHIKLDEIWRIFELEILKEDSPVISVRSIKWDDSKPYFAIDTKHRDDVLILSCTELEYLLEKRKILFGKICRQRPDNGDFENIIETSDFAILRDDIMAYVDAYFKLSDHLYEIGDLKNLSKLSNVDSILREDGVIMSPLHPTKLVWFLQYQELLSSMVDDLLISNKVDTANKDKSQSVKKSIKSISSLNFPPFISTIGKNMMVNTGRLHLLWSTFSDNPKEYRKTIGMLEKIGVGSPKLKLESVSPETIYKTIDKYLRLHPFVRQLKINFINPGDGSIMLDVIRMIQKKRQEDHKFDIRYELKFIVDKDEDKAATAFDRLMTEDDERKKKEEDDELIETRSDLMSPKLVYAKYKLEDYLSNSSYFESHITIIVDHFELNFGTLDNKPTISGGYLGGLQNDFVSNFEDTQNSARWIHTVSPQYKAEIEVLGKNLHLLLKSLEKHMTHCAFINSGNKDKWPSIILEMREKDRSIIGLAHARSDWVVIIDKYFDIDFLDSPKSDFCKYYIIDYSPSIMEGFGHKMIVSTDSRSELEKMTIEGLKELNISTESASNLVNILQRIHGKLAIKLLSSKNFAKDVLSIALLQIYLERKEDIKKVIFIPIDAHLNLFKKGDNEVLQRTDVILVYIDIEKRSLKFRLVENKFRSGVTSSGVIELKKDIRSQLDETHKLMRSSLEKPNSAKDIEKIIFLKEISTIFEFYIKRSYRHGTMSKETLDAMKKSLEFISIGDFSSSFEKEGVIFDMNGTEVKEEHIGDDIKVLYIGRDKILELLSTVGIDAENIKLPEDTCINTIEEPKGGNYLFTRDISWAIAKSEEFNITKENRIYFPDVEKSVETSGVAGAKYVELEDITNPSDIRKYPSHIYDSNQYDNPSKHLHIRPIDVSISGGRNLKELFSVHMTDEHGRPISGKNLTIDLYEKYIKGDEVDFLSDPRCPNDKSKRQVIYRKPRKECRYNGMKILSPEDVAEEQKPVTVEEQKPVTVEEQKPVTVEEQKPVTVEEQKPVTVEEQKPVTVEEQKPVTVEEQKLVTVEEQKLVTVEEQKPVTVEEQKPVTVEEQKPVTVEEQKLVTVEEQKPVTVEEQKPVTVEEQKPVTVEEQKLVTVEEQKPVTVEEQKPVTVEEQKHISVLLGVDFYSKEPVSWEPYRLEPRKLTNPHILIMGTTGAGKTQTAKSVLYDLWKYKIPTLILDFHGEYTSLGTGEFRELFSPQVINAVEGIPINPLDIPLDQDGRPIDPKKVIWEISGILEEIFKLGAQQQRALKRAIEDTYRYSGFTSSKDTWTKPTPKFSMVKDILEGEEDTGGRISSLLSRIDVLFDADIFSDKASYIFEDLMKKVTIVDLSKLFNDEHRLVVAKFFLKKIYNIMLVKGETSNLRSFILVDEAHRLSNDETLSRLIKEARKYGIGLLLSSQEMSDFSDTVLELPGTKIFLQLGPKGAKAASRQLDLSDPKEIEMELQMLDVGDAYIKNNHHLPYGKIKIKPFFEKIKSLGQPSQNKSDDPNI